jgi:hypothetical protein
MMEMDHTALGAPEPAKPILACDLLALEEKHRRKFGERGVTAKTGCTEMDDYVLGSGFERGIVVGLSGEGSEGRLVSASHFYFVLPVLRSLESMMK